MASYVISPDFIQYEWKRSILKLGQILELENEEKFSVRKVRVHSIWESSDYVYYYTEDVLNEN